MIRSLYTAATGMVAQQTNIDVIANNLANVNNHGYRRSRVDMADLFYQHIQRAGMASEGDRYYPAGLEVGLGTRVVATQKLFAQGETEITEAPYDIMVEGQGFIQVQMPDGSMALTRNGHFMPDAEGNLVNSQGLYLFPQISIPQDTTNVTISKDGRVQVTTAAAPNTPTEVGQIELGMFVNPAGLVSMGDNLFRESAASGAMVTAVPGEGGTGSVLQGALEQSNVSMIQELVSMITAQRAYEINSNVIRASDEMLQTANNIRR
ncbi:MAG: flagellar basal-body rod protein FlgG [Planctomycetota bacterium]